MILSTIFDPLITIRILLSENKKVKVVDKKNIYTMFKGRISWEGEYMGFDIDLFKQIFIEIFSMASKGITDRSIILKELTSILNNLGVDAEETQELIDSITEIFDDEIEQYRGVIEAEVEASKLFLKMRENEVILRELEISYGSNRSEILNKYKKLVHGMSLDLRHVQKVSDGHNSVIMGGNALKELVEKTQEELNDSASVLLTGYPAIDKMLGGFKAGTFTITGAPSGMFKSGIMLNWGLGMCQSNPDVVTKEKGKIPFIQYLTLENSSTLTFRRIAKHVLNINNDELKEMDKDVINEKIAEKFDSWNIKFKADYRKAYTMSAVDILGLISGVVDEQGREMECVGLIIDYLFLLELDLGDFRLSLSKMSRALADIGLELSIPVISALQLNGTAELAKYLTKSTVAEAKNILDHADDAFIFRMESTNLMIPSTNPLVPENQTKFKYLEGYHIKSRSAEEHSAGRQLIPFSLSNSFKLAENGEDSTFALFPPELLNNELDLKYGISNSGKGATNEAVQDAENAKGLPKVANPIDLNFEDDNPYE